jgi:hypothetical protein
MTRPLSDFRLHFGVVPRNPGLAREELVRVFGHQVVNSEDPEWTTPIGGLSIDGTWRAWGEDDGHNSLHLVYNGLLDGEPANDDDYLTDTVHWLVAHIRANQDHGRLVDYVIVSTAGWHEQVATARINPDDTVTFTPTDWRSR